MPVTASRAADGGKQVARNCDDGNVNEQTQHLPTGIRVVVFDVGETLVDESRMWAQYAEAANVAPFTLMGVIGSLIERDEPHNKVWDILGVATPAIETEIRAADLYPDALDCLIAAKDADLVVGIAGNQPAGATECLWKLGFAADFVASSSDWGISKPSPGFFSRIAESSDAEPHEILYVGDRLDNDIVPAAVSGFRTVLLERGPWGRIHSRRAESARADLCLGSLDELAKLLNVPDAGARVESANVTQPREPRIRSVRAADVEMLVELFNDLSYPATADQILSRVSRLLRDDMYRMWVVENGENGLDGFAAGHIVFPVEDDQPAAQLIALVTSEHARGGGLGAELCAAFEEWALSQGAHRAVVNSGSDRLRSHDFYKSRGWERTGLRFGKRLA
ncbi:GNAT family N-acetyltransferase [Gordonia shandongensis]|uniref:GNAT family N-acetyltransferase n=1 Tax=Gordonia shandongensis TaxID=376351 RepID=UPI001B7FEEF8|nr:GNAT family N-acetyltransferase [Gordonia shandongensis]